jgi:hypothetical protein
METTLPQNITKYMIHREMKKMDAQFPIPTKHPQRRNPASNH